MKVLDIICTGAGLVGGAIATALADGHIHLLHCLLQWPWIMSPA